MAPSTSRILLPQPVSATEPPLGESGMLLIWCPYCGMGRILELISKIDEHPNERFFKCPRKYVKFPLCDFYMFEEEYANFLINYGMLQESEMCHYHPLETAHTVKGAVQAEIYEYVKPLKKESVGVYEHGRTTGSARFNSAILLVLVLMQMFK
ncbi:unnamed protein product [Miscanthus lutarioriparius]|uniref:Uncharacterized protein n=1 Tax=Miscanthus lutarioriparius TaxID=422564 RepID=A0A811R184_9POAL|nr:unnamed protein product [Miscanthus lutarioriparius]